MKIHLHLAVSACCVLPMLAPSPGASADSEPAATFQEDFEAAESGSLPAGMMEIEGVFTVGEIAGRKALRLAEAPLAEDVVILGPSFKGAGSVRASIKADKRRRSFPRFGIGLHGISGYRLRVVGAAAKVELVKNEVVVASVPFDWDSSVWNILELALREKDGSWVVEGRVWPEGGTPPAEPTISLESDQPPGQGKASLWGTPYAGLPIWFDSVRVSTTADDRAAESDPAAATRKD